MGRGALAATFASAGAAVSFALVACGAFESDPPATENGDASPAEASVVDGAEDASDAGPPAKPCTDDQPFATVAPVELSMTYTGSPRLSPDELTIYVERSGALYVAKRSSVSEKFGPLVQLLVDSDAGAMLGPSLSGDGLGLYFAAGPFPNADLWRATRQSTTAPFGSAELLGPNVDMGSDNIDPYVLPGAGALYFASGSFSDHVLYRAALVGGAAQAAVAVAGLELDGGGANDRAPVVTSDERTIFFASSRDTGSSSTTHIWTATRSSVSLPFGSPQPLVLLNQNTEQPGFISPDRCRLYFARSNGAQPVFVATRTPPP